MTLLFVQTYLQQSIVLFDNTLSHLMKLNELSDNVKLGYTINSMSLLKLLDQGMMVNYKAYLRNNPRNQLTRSIKL